MLNQKALAAAVSTVPVYIEDVFSTYLYTGTGSTQTITNNIDLSGSGGLVWIKQRTVPSGTGDHFLYDSARGVAGGDPLNGYAFLSSNNTSANGTNSNTLLQFNSNGFNLGSDNGNWGPNQSSSNIASWTFRKQAKFFDIQTWTGTGSNRTIAHSLGSVPGCIIVKRTDTSANWAVYHRSLANTEYLVLNSDAGAATGATWWNSTTPTSSVFSLGTEATVNASGGTYVAYLFAHDAGGFGLAGTDNVISCGAYTTDGSGNATVTLGWEPQFLLRKRNVAGATNWNIVDVTRGWTTSGVAGTQILQPNDSTAESAGTNIACSPSATGMTIANDGASRTYIYIAIRRGPMKTPTSGTSVFAPVLRAGTGASAFVSAGFPVDMMALHLTNTANNQYVGDRLRGNGGYSLEFSDTDAESDRSAGGVTSMASMTGYTVGVYSDVNSSGNTYINWCFRRAPGFFDVVCYTGTGSATTFSHNLAAIPELMISKRRDAGPSGWAVYSAALGATKYLRLHSDDVPSTGSTIWDDTAPTSSVFTVGSTQSANTGTYVQYLFATLAGISKVGSYTGNGSNQTIDCGFTAGSRFVMIKRTDSTGDWYVWDSARGIVAGNDPHLSLNTTAAEVTTDDSVDTDNSGFIVNQLSATNINVSSATYIFLAVA